MLRFHVIRIFLMHLTLVIPGLLDMAAPVLDGIDAAAPALARLLAAAGPPSVDHDGAIAVICAALGIVKQHDWPIAPWLAHAAGIDATAAYWLCAEPATFTVGRGDVRLSGVVGDLESVETTALLSTINAHFAGDGIRFEAPHPARWLVGAVATQSLSTLPPEDVIGKPLLGRLPEGTDAARWRSWQNEVQMLLFEHPVNIAREAAGRPVVNSVWLWGGGVAPSTKRYPRIAAIYTNAWRQRELARAVDLLCTPVPVTLDVLRDKSPRSPAMVWLEPPVGADPQLRASWLTALDRDWATPARGAFHNGTIKVLEIVLVGRSSAVRFAGKRLSLARRLRTWRSAQRLSTLLAPFLEASTEPAWNS
jgi:hypothetical protein